jgi:DNA-binding NarL/FixJ family response regulator
MDLRMPVMDGVEAIRTVTVGFPEAPILALTPYEGDADIRRALDAARAVAVAVRLPGFPERSRLAERELEVLELVARGLSDKEAADAIGTTDEGCFRLKEGLIMPRARQRCRSKRLPHRRSDLP